LRLRVVSTCVSAVSDYFSFSSRYPVCFASTAISANASVPGATRRLVIALAGLANSMVAPRQDGAICSSDNPLPHAGAFVASCGACSLARERFTVAGDFSD